MGGVVPLGYRVEDRALHIVDDHAAIVRSLFRRYLAGERIRDKVAASKRKGIWMGGAVPLGYRIEDRTLHLVEQEAEFVRTLFRRYLEVGSVVRLKTALDAENLRSPVRMSGSPRLPGRLESA